MKASLVLFNQAETKYENAKKLNNGKWTEYLVKSSFFIANAILFIKSVAKESIIIGFEAVTKETVEELIENGLEEIASIFLKTAEKMKSEENPVDLSIINKILDYGYSFSEIIKNYYILKREKKELANEWNAVLAAKSIYDNNVELYNKYLKEYDKLLNSPNRR